MKERSRTDLAGRVAIVTGGAAGIGRGHAEALGARGADVAIADIDYDAAERCARELSASGVRAVAIATDVTDDADVSKLVESVVDRLGCVDILVCNAGGAKSIRPRMSFDSVGRDLWDQVVALNLTSAWLCAKHVHPVMQRRGWGRIVLTSSASATTALPLGIAPYIAAKGGVEALTRVLAREAGPHGITVNAVAPGFTPVEAVRALHGDALSSVQGDIVGHQALARVGTVEDVAECVAFLCSEAAAHITGQVIHVDGGWVL